MVNLKTRWTTVREYRQIHVWLNKEFGKAIFCENPQCKKKSIIFEWALKKGSKHSFNRNSYTRLCRSCHRKYDMTAEKIKQALANFAPTFGQRKGVKLSTATKNKISQSKKGTIPWNKGMKFT